jgi:CubicO group peptidase (beta-lactamase class C family)
VPFRTRRASCLVFAVSLLCLAAVAGPMLLASTPPQGPPGFAERWKATVVRWRDGLRARGIVGSSLLLMHQGRVVAREVAGLADLDAKRPVDERTIYHWASITKTVTGVAIMQLRDRDGCHSTTRW